jgi:hypothetical protein
MNKNILILLLLIIVLIIICAKYSFEKFITTNQVDYNSSFSRLNSSINTMDTKINLLGNRIYQFNNETTDNLNLEGNEKTNLALISDMLKTQPTNQFNFVTSLNFSTVESKFLEVYNLIYSIINPNITGTVSNISNIISKSSTSTTPTPTSTRAR